MSAVEKLTWLENNHIGALTFDEIRPDAQSNWLHLTNNDFETFIPLASKVTKAAKTAGKERAIFKLHSLGVVTNRDDWVYDDSRDVLLSKVKHFVDTYERELSLIHI